MLLFTVGGMRPDRLSLYGDSQADTPNMELLGSEAAVFECAAAQASYPLASLKSLLTGKYPARLMLEQRGADLHSLATLADPNEFLLETFTAVDASLASEMASARYMTACFTRPGRLDEGGFEHGFHTFDARGGAWKDIRARLSLWLEDGRGSKSFVLLATETLPADAREKIARMRDGDTALPAEQSAHVLSAYDRELTEIDARLGEALSLLRENDLYEEAFVIVTADHGLSLGERGFVGNGGLYREELLVPLIMKFPASWNVAPRSIEEPAELVDLWPTISAVSGVKTPRNLDGRSLLPVVLRGVRGRERLIAQTSLIKEAPELSSAAEQSVLRPGNWHAIHNAAKAELRFFSLPTDPDALVDLTRLGELHLPPELESIFGTAGSAPLAEAPTAEAPQATRPAAHPSQPD